MTKPADDFDAVRQIVEILEPFQAADRERAIRWAREKLGMTTPPALGSPLVVPPPPTPGVPPPAGGSPTDVKAFVKAKNPKNDSQLAATVAYFYRFVAPEDKRQEAINSTDLLEACRLADRKRPARAAQTMINAYKAGVFDKAASGRYKLNSVGENLVAMVLPGDDGPGTPAADRTKAGHRQRQSQSRNQGGGRKKRKSRQGRKA